MNLSTNPEAMMIPTVSFSYERKFRPIIKGDTVTSHMNMTTRGELELFASSVWDMVAGVRGAFPIDLRHRGSFFF